MKKIILLFLIVVGLFPCVTWGQSIAVTSVSYQNVWTDETLVEPAKIVEAKVIEALLEQGWEVIDPLKTQEAYKSFATGDLESCANIVCLKRLASELEATEAIHIIVKDNDGVDFNLEVVFANSEPIIANKSSSFDAFNRWLCDKIQQRLVEQLGLYDRGHDDSSNNTQTSNGLKPTAFIVSTTATCSFAVAFAITEIIGLRLKSNLDDLEAKNGVTESETKGEFAFRTADWTLLGLTGAGLITSTVLFFLTDFKQDDGGKQSAKASKSKPTITPALTDGGGFVSIQGTF